MFDQDDPSGKSKRFPHLDNLRETLAPLTRRISWHKPHAESALRYTLLPPYEIPSIIVIAGLIVENCGDRPAHNVSVTIRYPEESESMIHHMQVVSETEYVLRGGGEQHRFAQIRLREMAPDSKLFVYMATSHPILPEVRVSSYEKAAR